MIRPITRIDVEQACRHDKDPYAQVDYVKAVVEVERFPYAGEQQHRHQQSNGEGDKIRRAT